MDYNDRQAIEGLFHKLAQVEQQSGPRDNEAEHFIAGQISRQPGAPYFMAQTIVMQDHALNAAQARIEELEYQLQSARQGAGQGGGFLSRMFGGAPAPAQPQRMAHAPARPMGGMGHAGGMGSGPWQSHSAPQGGGFLAGAAQTAMGVAGGMLLGNAVMGMFADEAEAAPAPAPAEEEDTGAFEDAGGWDEEL